MDASSQARIYEQLNEHSVAIGQLNTAVTQIQRDQHQILSAIKEINDKSKPDYKWVWAALGVLVMIASGYTTLITTPMSARISRLENKSEEQVTRASDAQQNAMKGFAELSYRLGRLEILNEQKHNIQGN